MMSCTRVLSVLLVSVLLVVVLGGAVPASAAFTPAEATSVQRLFSAATDHLHAGMGDLVPVIRATNSGTRPSTAQVARLVVRAQRQLYSAIADLVGGSYFASDTRGRRFFVSRALTQMDAATATLAQAQAAATTAIRAGTNATQLERLRSVRIADALRQIKAFNRQLTFANPYPERVSPNGRRLILGPHGDYDDAQNRLNAATNFLLLGYDALIRGYAADSALPSYESLSQQMQFAALLYRQNVQAMATLANIPLSATTETDQTPFFRLLAGVETLTHGGGGPCQPDTCHGTPFNYNNLLKHVFVQVPYWAGRPTFAREQQEVLHRFTEAWDSTDQAVWFTFTFPECDQTAAPSSCRTR
jgi:hypothetical protein